MTFLNRRLFDNVSVFVDSLSGANRVAFDVNKPNGILTLAISGNIVGDNVKVGTGSPEGAVVGKVGDVYQRKDGGTNTTLYIKESGSGNTGWTALGAPVSGGGSLSGGIQGRAAIWGTSSSISASRIISEGENDITIRGTTIVTTAKADGSIWNSIIIRDGMLGNVNDSGDHPGSRILYESDEGANPYRASIEFGADQQGMDSRSRMTLSTQNAYYDPLTPGITIAGGTVSNGGGIYIKTSEPLPNNLGETVQISGSLLTSEEITAREGIIVSSNSSPTVQLKTSNADHTVENFIAEFGFSNNTIGGFMPTSGARIITYGNTPLTIKTKFAENPAGNSAIFNTTGNLLLKTNTDNNVDTLQVSGGAAISGALVSFNIRRGTGSPEGVVTATLGTIYQRTDGGTSTSVYIKETNTGNTGWTAIAPGTSGGGTSLTGGISGRAAIWSGTTNISASSTIIESSGRVLIGGSDNGSDKLQVTGSAGISGWMVSSNIKRGVGTPEGFVTGNVGDIFQRTDGSVNNVLYYKESGSGNTGWMNVNSTTGLITAGSIGASGTLAIYNRNFSFVDYYVKNAVAQPNALTGTYTLGIQFIPTKNVSVLGVRAFTAQSTGSITAKLWKTGTSTALTSATSTFSASGHYNIYFPTPYIMSDADIMYKFYATILTNGNLYTRTSAANSRPGADPAVIYQQEPGLIYESNPMSWWRTGDDIPNASSAGERYPVEPIFDMTLAAFSGLTTGSGAITGGLSAGQVAFGAGNNAISGSNSMTFSLTGGFTVNRSGALRSTTIGLSAGNNTMTGADNTYFGWRAGEFTTTATRNTAFGSSALSTVTDTSDNDNTAFGYRALTLCSQQQNTAVGSFAGELIASGSQNTVVGYNALSSNTGASNNTAIGRGALSGTTGGNNTGVGNDAGSGISGGTGNTVVGNLAGQSIGSGTNNVSIGSSSNIGSTLTNNIVIGAGATVLGVGSNGSVVIGTDADVDAGPVIGLGREVTIPSGNANTFSAGSPTYPMNNVYFGKGIFSTTPTTYAFRGTNASGLNIAGGGIQIAGGRGTGTAVGGDITLRTAPTSAVSSTNLTALLDRWSVLSSGSTIWYGITSAPSSIAVSTSGNGGIYFNPFDNKFKVSENGSEWTNLVPSSSSNSLSGGIAGRAAIWGGTDSISASRFIREYSNTVVISGSNEFIISNTYTGTPPAPNVSLAVGDVGDGVVTINDPKFLRIGYNIDSNYGFIQASRPDAGAPDLKLQDQGGLTIVSNGLDVNNTVLKNHISELINDSSNTINVSSTVHSGNIINTTSASPVSVVVPNDLPVGFTCLLVQYGVGTVTVSAGSGATVHNRQSHTTLAGLYSTASIVCVENSGGSSAIVVFAGDTAP